ncbi:arginine N-succinyltransferase [Neptunomonas antarctica]|uniref:Arginine N-succinyltransferase n=1 Tax=Neptunomonas antarctica TaxID=619304 RepID=A0A1N7NV70_9GAMM|nr:arginine N-succinyltransferase [Neptunomonas antarctica]SIT02176.1 arginine N-succinyltransferase [Neptunomonas antarctica]
MLIIRPCKKSDLDDLMNISHAVGKGMTSMPADEAAWMEKISASAQAFNAACPVAQSNTYFMVLEDTATGHLAGTTAIYTGVGLSRPFYSYKISTLVSSSTDLNIIRKTQVLNIVNDYTGSTEVGSIYLLPEYRKPGVGQFLSRARFLTMADFPERFGEQVIAELRGWQDENGRSPLWENLGKPFFGIEFQDAVNTAAIKGSQFISDLMPKYPIYIDLLPKEAQEVIGKPHDFSAPALHMLKKEGFQFTGYVDLFDGGPSVQANIKEIRSVKDSCSSNFQVIDSLPAASPMYLISNENLDNYRVALAPARLTENGDIMIDQATFQALQLAVGSLVRFITMNQSSAHTVDSQAA